MPKPIRSASVLLFLAALAGAAGAQAAKVKLICHGTVGSQARYSSTVTIVAETPRGKLTLESKETERVTVTAVAPDGAITTEHETESSERSINGRTRPSRETPRQKTVVVVRADN